MKSLDRLVLEKRATCAGCSYAKRLRLYRQQRQSLGELSRLAANEPRPLVKFATQTPADKPSPSVATSSESASSRDDEWFELSSKRAGSPDEVVSVKRQGTGNEAAEQRFAEEVRQRTRLDQYASWERLKADAAGFDERIARERDARKIRESVREATEAELQRLRRDVRAYDDYRHSVSAADSGIRSGLDEYYDLQRDRIGQLESLR